MPAKRKPNADSTATIGFEAKLWLTADSRSAAETAEGNRSNNMDAADWSGATKTARQGSPKGERGGANQYSRTERDNRSAAEIAPQGSPNTNRGKSRASVTRRASRGLRVKYISDTAGKCRSANAEIRTWNARPLRHSKFVLRHLPPPADARWSHLQASAKQPTVGMSNCKVRMTNRSRFTSTFENRQSRLA